VPAALSENLADLNRRALEHRQAPRWLALAGENQQGVAPIPLDWHNAGHSQRAIARELGIDRRKIKRIIDHPT
jgi:DNA-binding transcriptional regulator LsrR (DeoR family)